MKKLVLAAAILAATTLSAFAQKQPPGVSEAVAGLVSQPGKHTAFTLDHDLLDAFLGDGGLPPAALTGITFERYSYSQPAFYVPENMHAIAAMYQAAGWKHLVDANTTPGQSAQPTKPITDLWMHMDGARFDHITVLIRGPYQMNLIEVSGMLRPLDLVHLGGHFGIPKVDPNTVMVPAPQEVPPPPPQ
ncbi:hypothetical protein ACFQBQ_09815 [Granulicella cerasi]|uniref:DUF4252 domain-containing protein n=1 Tax=Granulicella cerasi TaxID=741063 RepID=A0ABW1Z8T1_9BACT|nr:hypothetical protein [Granulicella cerasi]